jgi:Cu(I)/Ag(I) efflux system protein CusF
VQGILVCVVAAVVAGLPVHAAENAARDRQSMTNGAEAQVHPAVGVVKAIDARSGTVTLAHEPVPALGWPAMVMPFSVSAELARGIQVGQKVNIEFTASGMNGTITKITVTK